MKTLALSLILVAAGCGGQLDAGDDASEAALSAPLPGIYQLTGDPVGAGDVVYLWLRGDGGFAWTRCYDADCVAPVVEDGTYQLTTSSGKRYVSFYQVGRAGDTKVHFNSMYAYSRTSNALKLRKTYSSRWMTLASVAEGDLCVASGGTWNGSCGCDGGWPTSYSPGAGGCWVAPAAGESACDDTQGVYSDDETNAAGTFCDCGIGRHLEESGCVANDF